MMLSRQIMSLLLTLEEGLVPDLAGLSGGLSCYLGLSPSTPA